MRSGISRIPSPPSFKLTLALTFACNLACRYCYVRLRSRDRMSRDDASRALDIALASMGAGWTLHLGFFGGEPLLALDELLAIAADARRRTGPSGIRVIPLVTTNGTRLTEQAIRSLIEAAVDVTVSYDGVREAHDAGRPARSGAGDGSHGTVTAALRRALDLGLDVRTNMVVGPATARWLSAGVQEALDLGVTRVVISPDYDATWNEASLAELEGQYLSVGRIYADAIARDRPIAVSFLDEKLRRAVAGGTHASEVCGFGLREMAIDPRGRIFPCERLIRDDEDDRWVIGRLPGGIEPRRLAALRAPLDRTPGDCARCALSPFCTRWCACVNLARTGQVAEPDGLVCFIEDLSIRAAQSVVDRLHPGIVARAAGGAS
jgi:uncharacterized protein